MVHSITNSTKSISKFANKTVHNKIIPNQKSNKQTNEIETHATKRFKNSWKRMKGID